MLDIRVQRGGPERPAVSTEPVDAVAEAREFPEPMVHSLCGDQNRSIRAVWEEGDVPCYIFFLDCLAPASPLLRSP